MSVEGLALVLEFISQTLSYLIELIHIAQSSSSQSFFCSFTVLYQKDQTNGPDSLKCIYITDSHRPMLSSSDRNWC